MTRLLEQFAAVANDIYNHHFTPGRSGNVSIKLDDGGMLISPSGACLGDITPSDIMTVDAGGKVIAGPPDQKPSMEYDLHRAVYKANPEAGAILHAHPVKATALAVAGMSLEVDIIPELSVYLGHVPLVPYEMPGTKALADAVAERLASARAVLLANHGVVVTGTDIVNAYHNLELLESFAEIVILTRQLGNMNELTPEAVSALRQVVSD